MSCGPNCRTGPEFDPDFEGPSEADVQRFGADFVSCPNCSSDVYDEAMFCPTCGIEMGDTASLTDKKGLSVPVVGAIALFLAIAIVVILMN